MNRIFLVILMMAMLLTLTSCGTTSNHDSVRTNGSGTMPPAQQQENNSVSAIPDATEDTASEQPDSEIAITLTVRNQTFSATLLDNETAHQLAEQFPLTLNMRELNGNEKYFYLDSSLPTDSFQPGQIHAGDLMLYGDNCLVLFYESFTSSYSYTRLGTLDDPAGLSEALGLDEVEVTFSIGGK